MRYKERSSHVTLYTQSGPIKADHVECRCRECSKGYYYGYTCDSSMEEQEMGEKVASKKMFKTYEEDCLEAEVLILL